MDIVLQSSMLKNHIGDKFHCKNTLASEDSKKRNYSM